MICNHPLTRVEDFNGKVTFHEAKLNDQETLSDWKTSLKTQGYIKSVKMIPCGQCVSCRLNKARDWANRIMMECQDFKYNYFVTLTYADEYLPIKKTINTETGEVITGATLKKEDLTKFNHDLRQYWERKFNHSGIRYYSCGEYGEQNLRPHYHCIIFNLPYLDDLVIYKKTELGDTLYTSETLSKIWKKGYVIVGEVTYESASYVARYVMKKRWGKDADAYYESLAKIPEFTTMSRMPGIGRNYYEANKETIYQTDEIFVKTKKGSVRLKPSAYFDRLYEQDEPEKYKKIKRIREHKNSLGTKLMYENVKTIDNIQNQREIQERNMIEKAKTLKREL